MYMKDLKHKMTLRLNDELQEYVNTMSDKFSISPSDFIRQCIAQNKDSRELAEKMMNAIPQNIREGLENGIDRKTDSNDKL